MNRRFNYTGRLRITRDRFSIRVVDDPSGGPSHFSADLSGLPDLGLDVNARVVVEPYVRSSSMRFDFGTIGEIIPPQDTLITDVDRGAALQFRIMVVDTVHYPGRLLALANQVRPRDENDDGQRKSILPLRETDLGEAVWRLQVSTDESPILEVNNRIPDLVQRIGDDPLLQGAIFPTAVREIMRVILRDGPAEDLEWVQEWREFAEAVTGDTLPEAPEPDAAQDIIETIIEKFCIREHWATSARPAAASTEGDYE